MFLLDTNVISELRKAGAGRADANVAEWARGAPAQAMYVSAITMLELEMGVLRIERRDATQGRMLRQWLDSQIAPAFADRILPVDFDVAKRAAALHVPDLRGYHDALIAATALVHGLTLVTRNTADFASMALDLLNPWERV